MNMQPHCWFFAPTYIAASGAIAAIAATPNPAVAIPTDKSIRALNSAASLFGSGFKTASVFGVEEVIHGIMTAAANAIDKIIGIAKCPDGSLNRAGLLLTYAYRSHAWTPCTPTGTTVSGCVQRPRAGLPSTATKRCPVPFQCAGAIQVVGQQRVCIVSMLRCSAVIQL
jgi:hypothetical protein